MAVTVDFVLIWKSCVFRRQISARDSWRVIKPAFYKIFEVIVMRETIGSRFDLRDGFTGFDYLRIGLSSAICVWHSWWIYTGSLGWELPVWQSWFAFIPQSFVPMFFALSGFLVAGSLERNRLHHFLALRVLRIVPALAFEVFISACVIGLALTALTPDQYFSSPVLWKYFLNIFGVVNVSLPGVFQNNPLPELSNPQLWTIPYELECYFLLAVLSLLGLVWRGRYLLWTAFILILAATIYISFIKNHNESISLVRGNFGGRLSVMTFLIGVLIYRHRASIPYSDLLGWLSLFLVSVLFMYPSLTWVATLPLGYFVVWVGLKQGPSIPFGDYSYGVYLFHFPVSQMLMSLFGGFVGYWGVFSVVALIGSAACAAFSWRFIERPLILKKKVFLSFVDSVCVALSRSVHSRK